MNINPRLDNFLSWLTGSVVAATAVMLAIRLQDAKREEALKAQHPPPSPTPAQEPLQLQLARAQERGRGRKAQRPLQIPLAGWKDIVLRTAHEIMDDRLVALAAGVTFFSLLALLPAIAAGVSSYALFADAGTIGKHLSILSDIVPTGALGIVSDEITRIAAKSDGKLTLGFLVGLGIAIWSANAGMKSIFDALNIIYDEQEKRGLVWLNATSLLFTICAIAAVGVAAALVIVFPLLLASWGLTTADAPLVAYLRWPLMFVLI